MSKSLFEIAMVALPKALGGAGTVAVNLVLLRYLGPEPYGMYSLCLAGILLSDSILGSALDMGVLRLSPLYREGDRARSYEIERAALSLKVLAGGGVCLLFVLLAAPLSRFLLHDAAEAHLIRISCAAAVSMLLLRSLLVHLQVDRRFLLYGALDLLHFGLKFGGVAAILVFAQATPGRVLWFFALGPAAAFVLGIVSVGRALLRHPGVHRGALRELLGYIRWFLITFALAALIARTDVFLLTRLSTLRELGIYSGGYAFAMIPELLGTYLAIVFGPRIMPYFRDGRFYPFFCRVQTICIAGAVALFVLAFAVLKAGGEVLLPRSFAESETVLLVLLPGALAGMAVFPLTISFLMFVRPRFLIRLDLATFPVMLVCYVYAIREHGALGAAAVTSASRFVKASIAQFAAWRYAALPPEAAGVSCEPKTLGA